MDESGAQINLVPEKKRGRKKKVLIFAGVGAAVVLVGVITALAVVRPWEGGETGGEETSVPCDTDAEAREQQREEINSTTTDIAVDVGGMSYDEAMAYLDEKLEEYAGTDYEFGIKMVKIYTYLNNGDMNEALELAERIDIDNIYSEELLTYYDVMSKIYLQLGEDGMSQYYDELYVILYNYLYSEEENAETE